MTGTTPCLPGRLVALVVVAVSVAVVAGLAVQATEPARGEPPPSALSQEPAQHFLSTYVEDDGRVVRRDQGGDTVSEGQAYALLIATSVGDHDQVRRVWEWTRTHLQRPDGLLSWTWADGRVVDAESATDADLDAAHALVLAGQRFADPALRAAGLALGAAVLDEVTAVTPVGRVLLPGTWVDGPPYPVNPSYASPQAYRLLAQASGDPRWDELAAGDRAVLVRLLKGAALPPDWAQVDADGEVAAIAPPAGGDVAFGLDAARVAVRYAAACDEPDVRLAATLAPELVRPDTDVRGVYDLGGGSTVDWQHPLALVAAAATADAAGQQGRAAALLEAADELDERTPTYYGSAWNALGPLLLTGLPAAACTG